MTTPPPATDPDAGATAYTLADGAYPKCNSEESVQVSSSTLAATAVNPLECAGDAHSTPLPGAPRLTSGPTVPKRHVIATAASVDALNVSLTMVPPV